MLRKEIKEFTLACEEWGELSASVPFSLSSVGIEAGKIKNPLIGRNIESIADTIPRSAEFRAVISVSDAEAAYKYTYLRVTGINARSEIFFNGKSYGYTQSQNRVYIFDVSDRILPGDNVLIIAAEAPLDRRYPINDDGERAVDYELPPYFGDMGIIGSCALLPTNSAMVKEVRVTQSHEAGRVTIMVDVDMFGEETDVRAIATLISPTGQMYYSGIAMGHGIITVKDPQLWWPRGLGEPDLYKLTVTLYYKGEAADIYERRIGLRSIIVSTDENGTPAIVVNGVKIFSRGATYVQPNAILPYVTKADTERAVAAAAEANMNTLRVFGVGYIPDEYFFELCDRYGIIVWQDISVHYIVPPIAGAFASGITASLRDVIAEISTHPSVAILYLSICECEGGDSAASADAVIEFREIAARILNPVVARFSSGAEFIPDPSLLESHDERNITRRLFGDSAAALPSLPDPVSLKRFISDREMNLLSPTAEAHMTVPRTAINMLTEIAGLVRMPSSIASLAYASSAVSAIRIASFVKRLRTCESGSMSAVLRQLNDGWPAISASMIDFFGVKKASLYRAKDFYAPLTVYAEPHGDSVSFYICNECGKPYTGKLMFAIYANSGECVYETSRDVFVDRLTASLCFSEDVSRYVSGREDASYIIYELTDAHGIVARGTGTFVAPKRYMPYETKLAAEIRGLGRSFEVKLTASAYAPMVHIAFDGIEADFDTDYVDHLGTDPLKLTFTTKEVTTVSALTQKMNIKCLWDV